MYWVSIRKQRLNINKVRGMNEKERGNMCSKSNVSSDNVTPVEDSRAIANAWMEAQYIETNGLSHRGALQSKEIHEEVVKFLKG